MHDEESPDIVLVDGEAVGLESETTEDEAAVAGALAEFELEAAEEGPVTPAAAPVQAETNGYGELTEDVAVQIGIPEAGSEPLEEVPTSLPELPAGSTPDQILDRALAVVAGAFEVPPSRIVGRERSRPIATLRNLAISLARGEEVTFAAVGKRLDGRTKSALVTQYEHFEERCFEDERIAALAEKL